MTEPVQIYSRAYYDRLKAVADRHWWTLGMVAVMDGLLRSRVPDRSTTVCLDVGCGAGVGLDWARRALPRSRRIGIDLSPYAIEHCRGLGADVSVASAEAIPLEDGTVDLVICCDLLQHLADHDRALREMRRVLKPRSVCYVRTNAALWAPPPGSKLFTVAGLRASLATAGLDVIRLSRANAAGSLAAEAAMWRGRRPGAAPGNPADAAPSAGPFLGGGYAGGLKLEPEDVGSIASRLKLALLEMEGWWIRKGGRLPVGHSLVALAEKLDG